MTALITPLIFSMAFFFVRDVESATQDMSDAQDLIDSATLLRQLVVETALFHETRSQEQWYKKIASMKLQVDAMRVTSEREAADLVRIRKKIELMQGIYFRLAEVSDAKLNLASSRLSKIDAGIESRSITSLLDFTLEVIDIAHDLIRGNREEASKALRRMQVSLGLVVLAMCLLIAFVGRLVVHHILRPLRIFEHGTQQIAAGDYSHRLKLYQQDEIGELATAFDSMTLRVGATSHELEKQSADLSDIVNIRTLELSKAKDVAEALSRYSRSLIEASLDPLVTINTEGKITDVNNATERVTGIERLEMIGRDFAHYFTEPEKARQSYEQVFADGFVTDYPLAIQHISGAVTEVLYNASVYRDDEGKVIGVLATARDVTERNLLDQGLRENRIELQQAMTIAEKANIAKSEFLSSMSHELRTPLNAVLGFAQLMESDSPSPTPSQKKSIDQILKAGWYLLELINEILDLAVIESGKTVLFLEPILLDEVIVECIELMEPKAKQRDVDLLFSISNTGNVVQLDRTRIKQVLINFLSNAVKYNKPGGTVTFEFDRRSSSLIRLNIRDTGFGMTEEQLAQLFQPFNRLGREGTAEEGTGIGLVTSRKLVEMMDGIVGVESSVGVGSVFWIEFTLAEVSQTRVDEVKDSKPKVTQTELVSAQHTVLYIEDNAANLALVKQLVLRRAGMRMLSAADGNVGVEFARAYQPDVIFMDLNLPGISGLEAMRLLRSDPATRRIPIVALSAEASPLDIENGLAAGFFAYLTKPISVHAFMETLDFALKSMQVKEH
ncbi:MAG: response regulator [Cytophaga sp.]|nr:response regulator [Undibacterium sp.]